MTHLHPVLENTPLAERLKNRHDPITGDAFQLGDEVVFCASCRSAFLKASWEYMDGTHCNQQRTLSEVPRLENLSYSMANPESDYFIMPYTLNRINPSKIRKYRIKKRRDKASAVSAIGLVGVNIYYFMYALVGAMTEGKAFPALAVFGLFIVSALLFFVQHTIWPYWPNNPPKEVVQGFGKRFLYTTNKVYAYSDVQKVEFSTRTKVSENTGIEYKIAHLEATLKNGIELTGSYDFFTPETACMLALETGLTVQYNPATLEEAEELRQCQERYTQAKVISLWEEWEW